MLQNLLWVKNEHSRSSATARIPSRTCRLSRKLLLNVSEAFAKSWTGQSGVRDPSAIKGTHQRVLHPPPQSFDSTASAPDTWLMLAFTCSWPLKLVMPYCHIPCRLVFCIHDLPMINHHSVPPSPVGATCPANALRERYASVGHKHLTSCKLATYYQPAESYTHNLIVLYGVGLAPCAHNPSIVAGDYDHKINAFVFDLLQVLNIARKVTDRATRCEGPRDGEKHDLLVREFFASMVCLRNTA